VALKRLIGIFVLGSCLKLLLSLASSSLATVRLTAKEVRFLAALFVTAAMAHSVLIFSPNHLPPDVPLHGTQISWLEDFELDYDGLVTYSELVSRKITDEAVLMKLQREEAEASGSARILPVWVAPTELPIRLFST
jgi:hypothetical protein